MCYTIERTERDLMDAQADALISLGQYGLI